MLTALACNCYTWGFAGNAALLLGVVQGMEKDIILLATTITHAGAFATDAQRVNVALTRARHHLIVLGCSQVLRTSSSAFRLLLSSCQILPAGACLVLPGALSNLRGRTASNLRGRTAAHSECADVDHDKDDREKRQVDDTPMSLRAHGNSQGQAWAVCSDAERNGPLPASTQTTRGMDQRLATAPRCKEKVNLPIDIRHGSSHRQNMTSTAPAAICPNPAVTLINHLSQDTPSIFAAQVPAPILMFDIDDI